MESLARLTLPACLPAAAVALVSLCWDTQLSTVALAVTGEMSLSGHLSSVSALRQKTLAAFATLVGTDSRGQPRDANLVVPSDNSWKGLVVEYTSGLDAASRRMVGVAQRGAGGGRAGWLMGRCLGLVQVDVPGGVARRVSVLSAETMFEVIALAIAAAPGAPPPVRASS